MRLSATEVGFSFDDLAEKEPRDSPIISRSMLQKFLQGHPANKDPETLIHSRGYVRSGEGINAEEMDRRTMEIFNRW
ncbi:MAG: hypothetical protein HQL81_13080 [Magnetococcales bacterium]|nr:hypothetical protein [Magnetococcales bacterium]